MPPVEVRQCPLRSSLQLRSGSAHSDRELAVEVRRRRSRRRRRRRDASLIESRDPHLAGGEKDSPLTKNQPSLDPIISPV